MVAVNVVGPGGAQCRTLSGRMTIGSSGSSDLILDHPAVAAHAVTLSREGFAVTVEALGGVVALNSSRMQGVHRLDEGDELKVGPYRIRVSLSSAGSRPATPGSPAALPALAKPRSNPSSAGAPSPSSGPPASAPGATLSAAQARARALIDARAKLIWGEPPGLVISELLQAGVRQAEATALVAEVIAELRWDARRRGAKDLIKGSVICLAVSSVFALLNSAGFMRFWSLTIVLLAAGAPGVIAIVVGGYRLLLAPPLYYKP